MANFVDRLVQAFLPCTKLMKGMNDMTQALDRLTAEVAEQRSATGSLIALVGGLADQLRQNAGDEEAIMTLADDLDAQQQEIADAVSANTPEAEAPSGETPVPAPAEEGGEEPLPTEGAGA